MQIDPLYSAKLRIARADEHIDNLKGEIKRFFAKQPYRRISEPDPNGTHEILKVQFTERFPFYWRILATEIVEHLRARLDHATWATGWLATGDPNLGQTAFPFAKTADDLDHSVRRRSKNIPPDILAIIRGFKPYKGGNDLLYSLNELCNTSKHALVAFVGVSHVNFQLTGNAPDGVETLVDMPIWDREKHDITYARIPKGSNFQHKANFRIYIALENIEALAGHPAAGIFDAMAREVERVISAIEAECWRLGLLT